MNRPEDYDQTWLHLTLTPEQLVEMLNLKGHVTHWHIQDENGYPHLHFYVSMRDGSGQKVPPGGYVEQTPIKLNIEHTPEGYVKREFRAGGKLLLWTKADIIPTAELLKDTK